MKKTAQSGSDREGETDMTRKEIRKKGFTLMELLGVVAIIGILSALIAVGVVAYNRSLKVMELNNTAEEIYIAAQNHLTALRTNAAAKDTLDTIGYGTQASTVSTSAPADLKDKSQWDAIYAFGNISASSGTTAASGGTVASGGTGTVASGNGSSNTSVYTQLATYILPAGAVDGTVAGEGNSYIIEYNPKACTVYGVFYADGKSSVLGRDTGETISVTNDLANLNKEVKANEKTKITSYKPNNGSTGICVGYYGGSGAGSLNSVSLDGSISVKLVNAEKLYAEITTKGLSISGASASDQTKKNIRLWLTVTGKTSGAIKTYGCTIDASGNTDDSKTDNAWKQQGNAVKTSTNSGLTVTRQVVLDDITTSGWHFAEIFSNSDDSSSHFIPGEDITVSASAAVTDSLSNIVYSNGTQSTNSLFASLQSSSNGTSAASGTSGSTSGGSSTGKTTETVTIANFRHLENLSPDVSHVLGMTSGDDTGNAVSLTQSAEKATNGNNKYQSGKYQFAAVLGNDLTGVSTNTKSDSSSRSWRGFLQQIQILNGKDSSAINGEVSVYYCANNQSSGTTASSQTASCTAVGSFAPVRNDYLSGFDGLNHTIEGVLISSDETSSGSRGLFSIVSPVQDCELKNVTLKNFDITAASTSDSNEVENYNTESAKINKIIPAGSLVGIIAPQESASVKVSGVTVLEDNSNTCGVWGSNEQDYATVCGGLIGEIYTADNGAKVSVKNSSSSVYVKSGTTASERSFSKMDVAGGLIGIISDKNGTISVEDSYSGGHTEEALSKPYYAMTNKERGTADAGWNVTAGNSAGGLIGGIYTSKTSSNKILISNVYSTASAACVDRDGNVISESDAGGLIGYISSNTYQTNILSVRNSYCTGLLEGTYKGGIAGYIALAGDKSVTTELTDEQVNQELVRIFSNCAWLKGVNDEDTPCANVLSLQQGNGYQLKKPKSAEDNSTKNQAMVQKSTSDLRVATNKEGTATPYDTKNLSTTYEFRLVTNHHYGDWPVVTSSKVTSNGNRNMIEIDTESNLVAVLITGLQSGGHIYLVFNNNALQADKLLLASSLSQIITKWKDNKPAELDNSRDTRNWQNLLQITSNKDGTYHYSFSLDNISQPSGFSFYQLAGKDLYYGENLDIRIMTNVTKNTDPMNRKYCDDVDDEGNKDLVVNSLFETIFTTETLNEKGAMNEGSIQLSSAVIQSNISYLNFNNGKDLKDEILKKENGKLVANFSPRRSDNSRYTAVVNNCRHLENLSDQISHVDTQNENEERFILTNAVQGCDIVWKQLWSSETSPYKTEYESYVKELKEKNNGVTNIYLSGNKKTNDDYFLPIHLTAKSQLVSYDGGGHVIAGMDVGALANEDDQSQRFGLFGWVQTSTINEFTVQNLTLEDPKVAGATQAGYLIGHSDRKLNLKNDHITYRYLTNPTVQTSQDCGGLVGDAEGGISVINCSISAGTFTLRSTASEGICVGGLIGKVNGSVSISGSFIACSDSMTIANSQYAGGLIAGGGSTKDVTVTDSYVMASELTVVSTSGDAYSGGIVAVGSGSTTIEKSYVESDLARIESNGTGGGGRAGGIIGSVSSSNSLTIKDCHISGQAALIMIDGVGNVGGLAGEISKPKDLKISNSYVSAYIYGKKANNAGGLVGKLETSATNDVYSEISDCYVSGRTSGDYYLESTEIPNNQTQLNTNPIMNVIGVKNAGGLIGSLTSGNVRISQTFSCASVYTASTDTNDVGITGGIIGYYQGGDNNKLDLQSIYATGLVKTAISAGIRGTMIGSVKDQKWLTVSDSTKGAYALSGVNDGNVETVGNNETAVKIFQTEPYSSLKRKDDSTVVTYAYDAALKDSAGNSIAYAYPIWTKKYVHGSVFSSDYYYDGDWINFEGGTDVKSITVSPSSLNLLSGETGKLAVMISPRSAATQPVTWTSDNTAVATVDSSGIVTGVGGGSVTITASVGGTSDTCTVTVTDVDWVKKVSLTLNGKNVSDNSLQYICKGDTATLDVQGLTDADATVGWEFDPKPSNSWKDGSYGMNIQTQSDYTTATVTITKDGVSIKKSVQLQALPKTSGNTFDNWTVYPELKMADGSTLSQKNNTDTRVVKGYTQGGYLYMYISDSGTVPFGNASDDGTHHYLYLKVDETPVVVDIKDKNNASVTFLSNQGNYYSAENVNALISDSGMQISFKIYIHNTSSKTAQSISLQDYGSNSPDNSYNYTLTGILSF